VTGYAKADWVVGEGVEDEDEDEVEVYSAGSR
jgi:hypothetical protein